MEQFLKEKKPVIRLLNYSILMMSSIIFFSCTSREEKEIKELMSVVFEGELSRGEEVIVFAEAEENWEIPWLDSCTVEGLLSLESDFRPKVFFKDVKEGVPVSDIYSDTDYPNDGYILLDKTYKMLKKHKSFDCLKDKNLFELLKKFYKKIPKNTIYINKT